MDKYTLRVCLAIYAYNGIEQKNAHTFIANLFNPGTHDSARYKREIQLLFRQRWLKREKGKLELSDSHKRAIRNEASLGEFGAKGVEDAESKEYIRLFYKKNLQLISKLHWEAYNPKTGKYNFTQISLNPQYQEAEKEFNQKMGFKLREKAIQDTSLGKEETKKILSCNSNEQISNLQLEIKTKDECKKAREISLKNNKFREK